METVIEDATGTACDHSNAHIIEKSRQAIETNNDRKNFSAKKNRGYHKSARKKAHDKNITPRYVHSSLSPTLALCCVALITEPKLKPNIKKNIIDSVLNIQIGGIVPILFNLCIVSSGLPNALLKKRKKTADIAPNNIPC